MRIKQEHSVSIGSSLACSLGHMPFWASECESWGIGIFHIEDYQDTERLYLVFVREDLQTDKVGFSLRLVLKP